MVPSTNRLIVTRRSAQSPGPAFRLGVITRQKGPCWKLPPRFSLRRRRWSHLFPDCGWSLRHTALFPTFAATLPRQAPFDRMSSRLFSGKQTKQYSVWSSRAEWHGSRYSPWRSASRSRQRWSRCVHGRGYLSGGGWVRAIGLLLLHWLV